MNSNWKTTKTQRAKHETHICVCVERDWDNQRKLRSNVVKWTNGKRRKNHKLGKHPCTPMGFRILKVIQCRKYLGVFKEIVKLPKSCTPHSYEHLAKCHQLASSSWFQNSLFINLTTLWNFEVHWFLPFKWTVHQLSDLLLVCQPGTNWDPSWLPQESITLQWCHTVMYHREATPMFYQTGFFGLETSVQAQVVKIYSKHSSRYDVGLVGVPPWTASCWNGLKS